MKNQVIVHPENIITIPEKVLNHLGKPFAKAVLPGHPLRRYCRRLARRIWRRDFADKQLWRNARHTGAAFSFRIYTGRCIA